MELTGVQVGLDMASALAIIGSAGTWYYNQLQEKKKDKEEEREKQKEDSIKQVSLHLKKLYPSILKFINFKNSGKLEYMQKLGMNPNKILGDIEKKDLEGLKKEYVYLIDAHKDILNEIQIDNLLYSNDELKKEVNNSISIITEKLRANPYILEVTVFFSIILFEQLMLKTSSKDLVNTYILSAFGITIEDINKNIKELEEKGMIKK